MFFCFADESGNEGICDSQCRFFIICGMLVRSEYLLKFEEKVANLGTKYNLKKKINLKSVQRWHYDYKRFGSLSLAKRVEFWTDLYEIFRDCDVGLAASILDKWSFAKKYKPEVRESIISRTYMHFLEKTDQVMGESGDFQIIIFDETSNKDIIKHKHYWWVNHKTTQQAISNSYWAPFFITEEESHLLQMAHICAYNLDHLFNKQKTEYFDILKEAYCEYKTKSGKKLAMKVFPDVGRKQTLFRWKNHEICYWDYVGIDLRSVDEMQQMEQYVWPPVRDEISLE